MKGGVSNMNQEENIVINLPGLDDEMKSEIANRVKMFEQDHEADVTRNGDGWVPRVKRTDYLIGGIVNFIIVIWLLISFA
jgi:hypothetical protein